VNFGDGHSALVTCYIAGVDVEWSLTLWRSLLRLLFVAITYGKVYSSIWLWKSPKTRGIFFSYFVVTLSRTKWHTSEWPFSPGIVFIWCLLFLLFQAVDW